MKTLKTLILFIAILFVVSACKKEEEKGTGRIEIEFVHQVDGSALQTDQMIYVNEAGNSYEVNEVQWFVTRLAFYKDGKLVEIPDTNTNVHYIDTDIASTFNWLVFDSFPEGNYDSLSFTFGFNEADNTSYRFPNPPESNMFWPEVMGGGYHYMKLNGKWLDPEQTVRSFNFHLGIGQIYEEENPIPIELIHNHFRVTLPLSSLKVEKDKTTKLQLVMNIEDWFKEPNLWDFNAYGSHIMKNQEAMHAACENGHKVFSIGQVQVKP